MILSKRQILIKELKFRTSRSSGPGGQNVNKVSSRVELMFDINNSSALSDVEKTKIFEKLANRINSEGVLLLSSEETRSQLKNKQLVISRFVELLEEALKPEKKRRKTKPTAASREKRINAKKKLSNKKDLRKPPTKDV